jgi:heme exporter protein A
MKQVTLSVDSLSKVFNRRTIFEEVSFTLQEQESLAVTGRNGSGKSTLAKILCGLLSSNAGYVRCSVEGKEIPSENMFQHVGFVAPYLNMYEEFSGKENLRIISNIRNLAGDTAAEAQKLLKEFGIFERRNDDVRTYSSGMKQRLKYAAALLHHPEILILDEPTANLDQEGIDVVRKRMKAQTAEGILLIATNEREDLEYVRVFIDLDGRKTSQVTSQVYP